MTGGSMAKKAKGLRGQAVKPAGKYRPAKGRAY